MSEERQSIYQSRPPTDGLNSDNMKFTAEQINGNGIVIQYLKQSAIAHDASEAVSVIDSFKGVYGNLKCNEHALRFLDSLFAGEELPEELKTTNCSKYGIRFWPAEAATIEEHNAIYRQRLDQEKERRIRQAEETNNRLKVEFQMLRKGWYFVSVELTAIDIISGRRRHMTNSGYGMADCKSEAYDKFVRGLNDECSRRGLIYEMCSSWNSSATIVDFVGMRVDDGFSIEAWEEYMRKQS